MKPNPEPSPVPASSPRHEAAFVSQVGTRNDLHKTREGLRLAGAVLLPVVALGLQWMLWPWIKPFAWFLFYPAVFFSARLGGYRGGLISTALSAAIVCYFFLPPQLSWSIENPHHFWPVGMFLLVGYLISKTQARLERASQTTASALEQSRSALAESARTNSQLRELTLHLEERVAERTVALQDKEERLRLFIQHAPVALAMFDPELRYLAVSQRWLADYELGDRDILGHGHYELFPNLPERWKQAHQRGLAGEVVRVEEDMFVRADGREQWGRWEVRPWRQADGRIGGLVVCVEDITARKTREREIDRLNGLLATLSQINQVIVRVTSQEELAREVARVAIEFGGFKLAWVGQHDASSGEVRPLGWAGEPPEFVQNFRHTSADATEQRCPCAPVIRKNRSCVANNLSAVPEMHAWGALMEPAGIRAAAVFPIRVRSTVWGVFGVYAGQPGVFQDKEVALLEEAAMDIGFAVEHLENQAQRKQAEAALRHQEATLRGILNATKESIWLFGLDGTVLLANETAAWRLGSAIEEVIGRRFEDLLPQPLAASRMAQMREVVASRQSAEFEDQRAGLFFHHSFYPILDAAGRVTSVASFSQDITERRQAEAEFRRTHDTLVEAQKIAHLGSFEYVAATRTTVWSEEEYRIYGLDPTGPSPAYSEMLVKCVHPDDAALLHESFTKAMQSRSVYDLEHRIVRPDGSVRWVHDLAHPYFDEHGELVRYVGTTLDITERKRADEQLKAQAERLAQSNEELTRFNRLMSNREMHVIELKQQINDLTAQLGLPRPYPLAFMNAAAEEVVRNTTGHGAQNANGGGIQQGPAS